MELIFFPAALLSMIAAIVVKQKPYVPFVILGYIFFSASLVHCLFDVAQRIQANDTGGILDIYPSLKWIYLIMLIVISVMAGIAFLIHQKEK